jgi:hypothetical protein
MAEVIEGQLVADPSSASVQPQAPVSPNGQQPIADPSGLQSLEQFVVPDPNADPSSLPANGQPQGQQPQTQAQIDWERQYKELQSYASRVAAENQMFKQQFSQPQQPQQPYQASQNPYDPNTQPNEWWRKENEIMIQRTAMQTRQELMDALQQAAAQQSQMQVEREFSQRHPGVDFNAVKFFAQQRGIANPEDAYLIMTLPNQLNQVRAGAQQEALKQFNQTQAPVTMRGSQPAQTGTVNLSFEQMANAYVSDPKVFETWHPEVQKMFKQELMARQRQR